jgi:glycosyltransferase involved in cell wall biosynthesis
MRSGFLYLGRVHPKKGIENLIDAFNILTGNGKILTIAGNGKNSYVGHLKASVMSKNLGDRITFVGHVEGDTKADLYKSCKALVLPSFSENFGNVVVEAMSYGLPVIASMNTPWMEIQTEKCGYWTDNSPMSLATAMERLTTMSQSEYQQMSVNAHRFAREKYDINSKGPLLERLVVELLS